MKNQIRYGIIGCSSIASRSTIPAIIESKYSHLEMIGSRSIEKAKTLSNYFSCNSFGNYDEILENSNVDAVYISLPIGLQEKWVLKAAKAGKHILCEKSMTTSHKSTKKILNSCKQNESRLLEGFTYRFHPQHEKICSMINQNILGKVFAFSAKYGFVRPFSKNDFRFTTKLGGGSLNDLGCYIINSSRMVFNDNPVEITCNLINDNLHKVDIQGTILMKYNNNKIAHGLFGYNNYFQSTYDLWSDKSFVNLEWAYNIKKNISAKINLTKHNKTKQIILKPKNQFTLMIDNFSLELQKPGSSKYNFENDVLNQSLVMECARLSNQRNKPVYLPEINPKK
jgi:D-xylose 1-dehydrogenase (NADP+, D-xylono-1,5-lactone-forming)